MIYIVTSRGLEETINIIKDKFDWYTAETKFNNIFSKTYVPERIYKAYKQIKDESVPFKKLCIYIIAVTGKIYEIERMGKYKNKIKEKP